MVKFDKMMARTTFFARTANSPGVMLIFLFCYAFVTIVTFRYLFP